MPRLGTRRRRALQAALVLVALAGCRQPLALRRDAGDTAPQRAAVAHGAVLYEGYCAGCHGPDGRGDGPVADVLGIEPADLGAPAIAAASEEEIVDRLLHGSPLRTAPRRSGIAEERTIAELTRWVEQPSSRNWDEIRAGRVVYETACAACHGIYGDGMGTIMGSRPASDLQSSQGRFTDRALAAAIRDGIGDMPPMAGALEGGEMRPLIAYLRVLSPGYRAYGTYCASCHGDDGLGVHPEDRLPPALAAPPIDARHLAMLAPRERQDRILHMFRREQGLMPHFSGILGAGELRDVVAYLRR